MESIEEINVENKICIKYNDGDQTFAYNLSSITTKDFLCLFDLRPVEQIKGKQCCIGVIVMKT